VKEKASSILRKILPKSHHTFIHHYIHKVGEGREEYVNYIDGLTCECRTAIDVGAALGLFTYPMTVHFDTVHAFEPLSEKAEKLELGTNAHVYNVALSKTEGTATLSVPVKNGVHLKGWSSLAPTDIDIYNTCEERTVTTVPLDSYEFSNVDLLKIDVEGHELDVLQGARETIATWRPTIIIEVWSKNEVGVSDFFDHMAYEKVAMSEVTGNKEDPSNPLYLPKETVGS